LSLGECSGLQSTFDACKAAGSCPACNGENPPPPPSPSGNGNYNYCGLNWADANTQCGETCYGGTNEECSSGFCFADATNCPMVYDGTSTSSILLSVASAFADTETTEELASQRFLRSVN